MIVKSFTVENFKGIRDPIRIDLKPVTLLFGPNSSGKSTIIQAFHYAKEVFRNNNLDPDKTVSGGETIDLGGFGNFVFGQDLARSVKLTFEVK